MIDPDGRTTSKPVEEVPAFSVIHEDVVITSGVETIEQRSRRSFFMLFFGHGQGEEGGDYIENENASYGLPRKTIYKGDDSGGTARKDVELGANLGFVNDCSTGVGIVAGSAEIFTRSNAGAGTRIAYTTLNGASAWVSSDKVLKTLKVGGNATVGLGVFIDITLSATGQQSWAKTLLNTTVGGVYLVIGGTVGAVIGTGYLILDKTGMLNDRPSGNINYTPPSIAMPEATRVSTPRLIYP